MAVSRRIMQEALVTEESAWQGTQILQGRWLSLFQDEQLHETINALSRTDLNAISAVVYKSFLTSRARASFGPLDVHHEVRAGLPGHALYLSAAMGFDTMGAALDYFDLTNKTARRKRDEKLSTEQGEHALRLATVASIAAGYFGSPEAGKRYLHTANFALGGETPIELLRTAAGEELVLQELQAQMDGGPV